MRQTLAAVYVAFLAGLLLHGGPFSVALVVAMLVLPVPTFILSNIVGAEMDREHCSSEIISFFGRSFSLDWKCGALGALVALDVGTVVSALVHAVLVTSTWFNMAVASMTLH